MGTITLTTDFGTRDWFVGAMKAVILGLQGDRADEVRTKAASMIFLM